MRMSKQWSALTEAAVDALPAQLGVYEIGDEQHVITRIGCAGGNEPFGMRTALHRERQAGGVNFRLEFTHAYLTRWQELLMIFHADHGELPPGNDEQVGKLGTLHPGGAR